MPHDYLLFNIQDSLVVCISRFLIGEEVILLFGGIRSGTYATSEK